MKYKIFGAFIILFLFISVYYIYPFNIDYKFNGVIYSKNKVIDENATIIIKGKEYNNLFANDEFKGSININDEFNYDINLRKGSMGYSGLIPGLDEEGNLMILGTVNMTSDLKYLWSNFKEIDEIYGEKSYITGPAESMEEGNEVARKVINLK